MNDRESVENLIEDSYSVTVVTQPFIKLSLYMTWHKSGYAFILFSQGRRHGFDVWSGMQASKIILEPSSLNIWEPNLTFTLV